MKEAEGKDMNFRTIEASSNEELRDDWLREAQRRATEWDEGVIQPTPGDEVLKKARALIR
ncbi:hypothetical protein P40_08080 [Alloalcanivorax xenomutans]|jgi:hypothetical protein|nr:hypothetical protein P40_08080 [Alloalcanivorax xenomutans]KYZ85968.1 hypothetical protein A3Q32_19335 [Alcanivorax sp. KX64203]